jgi:hypothetical protein
MLLPVSQAAEVGIIRRIDKPLGQQVTSETYPYYCSFIISGGGSKGLVLAEEKLDEIGAGLGHSF